MNCKPTKRTPVKSNWLKKSKTNKQQFPNDVQEYVQEVLTRLEYLKSCGPSYGIQSRAPASETACVEPFANSHLPLSTLRQLGHCIAPFVLKADPMQSVYHKHVTC